ncbi:lipoprotein [Sulfuricaulis limicola]|uniref:Lipoprotein n=1 Tax=Sulfuricaulis limicola TaxID=1620215 RepID=A0A1B4XFY6_9GAMM|nr:XdhC family protein [Sulfuricaulis limicola]BAV33722.1 lipoprotein [Sulfuricaulis limicola]
METADHEVLRTAVDWLTAGEPVYLATVAKTFGSSPRPPGSLAVLRADGRFAGSVSGGCMEEDLVARLRAGRLPEKFPAVVAYGVTGEEARRFGLPCGGKLELVLERLESAAALQNILERIDARQQVVRHVCLDTGEASLHPASARGEFFYDGRHLHKLFGPGWRLLLIGAGQLSRFVAQMGQALDYEVIVCEPREELASLWQVDGTILDAGMPDDTVRVLADARCAVLALTHDPRLDDMALLEALASPAFYVGALGSHANNDKRRARLASLGVSCEHLARLHGPVGLPIGSRTPAEIAVAVLAGVTAARHGIVLAAEVPDAPVRLTADG